jgi:hypothetical protein
MEDSSGRRRHRTSKPFRNSYPSMGRSHDTPVNTKRHQDYNAEASSSHPIFLHQPSLSLVSHVIRYPFRFWSKRTLPRRNNSRRYRKAYPTGRPLASRASLSTCSTATAAACSLHSQSTQATTFCITAEASIAHKTSASCLTRACRQ